MCGTAVCSLTIYSALFEPIRICAILTFSSLGLLLIVLAFPKQRNLIAKPATQLEPKRIKVQMMPTKTEC